MLLMLISISFSNSNKKRVLTISASKHGFANFPENVTNGGRFVKSKMPRPLKGPHSLQAEMAH
jgi:hypothetical protein